MRPPDPDAVKATADRAEARRDGRGRVSAMDLVPDDAQDDIVWAVQQLNERKRSAEDIRFELNDRLAAKNVEAISRSAFNRKSMKLARMSSRIAEARSIFQGLAPQFTPDAVDESSVALGEFIKLLCLELVQNEGDTIGPKGAMELARAHLAVIQGQKLSTDRRAKLEADFKAQATAAVDQVARAKGISAETVDAVKANILGIRREAAT